MTKYTNVPANPVKRFFVEMLTRDIDVEDAILDLLDNCVDGILRSIGDVEFNNKEPYMDYWAKIEVSGNKFQINDNCGGIPWSEHDKAFRMALCVYNNETTAPNNLECRAKEQQYVSRRKIPKITRSRSDIQATTQEIHGRI